MGVNPHSVQEQKRKYLLIDVNYELENIAPFFYTTHSICQIHIG